MGRLESWLDRDQQIKDGYNEILEDSGGSVDVYRNKHNTQAAGFDSEVGEPLLLRTIVARIDPARDRTVDDQPSDQTADARYTGLTDDTDVKIGDIWHWHNMAGNEIRMRVTKHEPTLAGTAVGLDLIKTEQPG